MGHCRVHGHYPESWTYCESCRDAEERAGRDREEAAREAEIREEAARDRAERAEEAASERAERTEQLAVELAHRLNNPGDYQCLYCLMISLKHRASRCPRCQHDIDTEYWDAVDARELEARRQEKLRRIKEDEERERKRKAEEEWLNSPAAIAEREAEATRRRKEVAAAAAAAAARSLSINARRMANVAACLSFASIPVGLVVGVVFHDELFILVCGAMALSGLCLGVVAIVCFLLGSGKQGVSTAVLAVAVPVVICVSAYWSRLL